jgi:N-acetylneuraminic acid mutarotase
MFCLCVIACGFPRPADVLPADDDPGTHEFQLLSLAPSIAGSGDMIVLEGTFDSTVVVNFPGGVSRSAVVLGPHRATVMVPASATTGSLSVTTGSTTIGSLAFRHTSFAPELQNFQSASETGSFARQTPVLDSPRSAFATAIVGDYLYVIGGSDSTGYLRTARRARINPDGSLAPFLNANADLVTARSGHMCVVIGIFVYVIGGAGDSGPISSIERATVAPDGSLGPFTVIGGLALTQARRDATSVVLGNGIYVIGGTGSGVLNTIERANVNNDGSLDAFRVLSDVTLATARTGHTTIIIGEVLYVIGGSTASSVSASIERSAIRPDGSLSEFSTLSGSALRTAREGHVSIVLGNALYVIGGLNSSGPLSDIERAPLVGDNSLGAFVALSLRIPVARRHHVGVRAGNFLYMVGGEGLNGEVLSSIDRSSIDAGESLGEFSISDTSLSNRGVSTKSISLGRYMYVAVQNSISRAELGGDGTLGPFLPLLDLGLDSNYESYAIAVVKNSLYLIGGAHDMVTSFTADAVVKAATINADGTITKFSTVPGVSLTTPRSDAMVAIAGNRLYVMGGFSEHTQDLTTVEQATIADDGQLGPFSVVGSLNVAGRGGARVVVTDRFLYVIGGSSSGAETTIERAAINSDGSLGQFALVLNVGLTKPRRAYASAVVGQYVYIIGGLSSSTTERSIERSLIGSDGSLSSFSPFARTLSIARSGASTVVIGNSLYVVGGFAADLSLRTDIEQSTLQ